MGTAEARPAHNRRVPRRTATQKLADGPFSRLDGAWHFAPVPKADGAAAKACKVDFSLHYAFSSKPLEALVSPVFDSIANTFVDSFVKRAEQVYGQR